MTAICTSCGSTSTEHLHNEFRGPGWPCDESTSPIKIIRNHVEMSIPDVSTTMVSWYMDGLCYFTLHFKNGCFAVPVKQDLKAEYITATLLGRYIEMITTTIEENKERDGTIN